MKRYSVSSTFIVSVISIFFYCMNVKGVVSIENVELETNGSTIIGRKLFTVYEKVPYAAFYDIAYAEPPLEKLRFQAPRGPRMIKPLTTYDFRKEFNDAYKFALSENCLHLTVYMPLVHETLSSFPVVVWIYENAKFHDPDFFIEEGILVVSVSFRTSIFGFLNTEDEFARGNMGAKDVLMSLRWIRDNIHFFNGNFNKVTVVGSGLGADIVASLLVSSNAEDLFARAIIQSGSALAPENYRQDNSDIIKKLHCRINGHFEKFNKKKLHAQLRKAPFDKLIAISHDLFDSTEIRDRQRRINSFACSIEKKKKDAFMYEHPSEVYKNKMANYNVDVMMGFTNLEALFKLKEFIDNRKLLRYINYNFQYILPFRGKSDRYNSRRYKKIRQRIMKFYFLNGTMSERSLRRYVKYHSDQTIYPLLQQAMMHSEKCRKVYLYRFVYNGRFNIKWKSLPKLSWPGATSGDEICYQFKCKSLSDVYNREKGTNEDRFIRKMTKLLSNFIKYGDPTPNDKGSILGRLKWEPLIRNHTFKVLNIGKYLKILTLPEEKRIEFWDALKTDFFSDREEKEPAPVLRVVLIPEAQLACTATKPWLCKRAVPCVRESENKLNVFFVNDLANRLYLRPSRKSSFLIIPPYKEMKKCSQTVMSKVGLILSLRNNVYSSPAYSVRFSRAVSNFTLKDSCAS